MYDEKLWTALCGRGRRTLSEYFQYAYPDDLNDLYIMNDNSIGFILEFYPILGIDETRLKHIADLFSHPELKEGDAIQVINYASEDIDQYLENYLKKKTKTNNLLKDYCKESALHFMRAQHTGFKGLDPAFRPKDFRVLISFRTGTGRQKSAPLLDMWNDIKSVFSPSRASIDFGTEINRTMTIRTHMMSLLSIAGTGASDLSPDGLLSFYDKLFGVSRERIRYYSPSELLSSQIVDSSISASLLKDNEIDFGSRQAAVFTIKKWPKYITPGNTYEMLGSMFYDSAQLPPNTLSVLNVRCKDKAKAIDNLDVKITTEEHVVKGYRKNDSRKKELEKIRDEAMSGFQPHEAYLTFITIAGGESGITLNKAALNLTSQIEAAGYHWQRETMIKMPLFLNALPLNFNPLDLDWFQRKMTLSSWNLACAAPIYGDYKGSLTPSFINISRRSQLVGIDFFDRNLGSNQVILVFGQSGLGKSFLIQGITANYLAEDAMACIIEVADESNSSYKNSTLQFDGKYVDLTNYEYTLNPFTYLPDEGLSLEDWNIMVMILSYIASPQEPISEEYANYLDWAVRKVVENSGRKGTLDEVYEVVKEKSTVLADKLYGYTSQGRFGDLFDPRKPGIIFDTKLTTIQIPPAEIVGKNALTLMYLSAIYRYSLVVYGKKHKGIKKLAIYDEAHNVLHNPMIAEMLEKQSRQYRRCDGAVIIGSQNLEDVYLNPNAKALVDNAAYQFIFQQPAQTLARLKAENKLIVNDEVEKLFASIQNRKGMSEYMLLSQKGQSILRHIGNPMDRVLFGSSSQEKAKIENMMKNNMDLRAAVAALMEEANHAA